MSVYFKVYQFKGKNPSRNGKWYGRVAYTGNDDIDKLAASIEAKCTVHRADVVAVIYALIDELTASLQASHRVVLPKFGTFKIGMSTTPANERKDFTANNVKHLKVLFQPEMRLNRASNTHTRAFLEGVTLKELESYEGTDKDKKSAGGGSASSGGTGTTASGDSGSSSQGGGSSSSSSGEEEGGEHS